MPLWSGVDSNYRDVNKQKWVMGDCFPAMTLAQILIAALWGAGSRVPVSLIARPGGGPQKYEAAEGAARTVGQISKVDGGVGRNLRRRGAKRTCACDLGGEGRQLCLQRRSCARHPQRGVGRTVMRAAVTRRPQNRDHAACALSRRFAVIYVTVSKESTGVTRRPLKGGLAWRWAEI